LLLLSELSLRFLYFKINSKLKLEKNIQLIAKEVLKQEGETLLNLSKFIDDSFSACVETILQSTGRVVVTGVGKSAIIGQKIVATMNSTGTPALFMHAADAIHGDLGMIRDNDIVLAISRSGDTSEIKVLVPLLRRSQVPLIALVSQKDSFLAKQADFILHAYAPQEADPLGLAPTTSTTAALALGDALAICLLELRGFTKQDFARYHPGGALGKKLYLKVKDLLGINEVPKVDRQASLQEVILEISSKRLGATAVVDANNELIGIITDGDLRRMLKRYDKDYLFSIQAQQIMTSHPITIHQEAYAVEALRSMQQKSITQLVVVVEGKLVGFVHLHDLIREGIV
jgi:arabinose-5-phosphate isomerase